MIDPEIGYAIELNHRALKAFEKVDFTQGPMVPPDEFVDKTVDDLIADGHELVNRWRLRLTADDIKHTLHVSLKGITEHVIYQIRSGNLQPLPAVRAVYNQRIAALHGVKIVDDKVVGI